MSRLAFRLTISSELLLVGSSPSRLELGIKPCPSGTQFRECGLCVDARLEELARPRARVVISAAKEPAIRHRGESEKFSVLFFIVSLIAGGLVARQYDKQRAGRTVA